MNTQVMKSMSRLFSSCTAVSYRHGCYRGVRGPLNQLFCGSVNTVNVAHFVVNYTSYHGELWAYMVSLINLDHVMAV